MDTWAAYCKMLGDGVLQKLQYYGQKANGDLDGDARNSTSLGFFVNSVSKKYGTAVEVRYSRFAGYCLVEEFVIGKEFRLGLTGGIRI